MMDFIIRYEHDFMHYTKFVFYVKGRNPFGRKVEIVKKSRPYGQREDDRPVRSRLRLDKGYWSTDSLTASQRDWWENSLFGGT